MNNQLRHPSDVSVDTPKEAGQGLTDHSNVIWKSDRILMGDLVFRLEGRKE